MYEEASHSPEDLGLAKKIETFLKNSFYLAQTMFRPGVLSSSFDKALEVDGRVWEILPKIQARKIKELLKLETATEEDLISALKFKLDAEDFVSEILKKNSQINITIKKCPWLALLKKSHREHLAERISDVICSVEYGVFAGEFMEDMDFEVISRRCSGNEVCLFTLEQKG